MNMTKERIALYLIAAVIVVGLIYAYNATLDINSALDAITL